MAFAPLRWGICSAGKICNDFSACLAALPDSEHIITAVASSSFERSKEFAATFGAPKAYGSYNDLVKDNEVDVVYVGSINTKHSEHVKMMLDGGKHVLCEKPMCLTVEETEELVALARKKNLFLMEAVWSRCFPAYDLVKKLIKEGAIGDVNHVNAAFGIYIPDKGRVAKKDLGGGAVYDLGIYTIQLAQYIFQDFPTDIVGCGFLNEDGVDKTVSIALKYSNSRLASLTCSSESCMPNEAQISGSKGFIRIHFPFWCPTKITVNDKTYEVPLPDVPLYVNFDNSQGLTYEAQEVRRCLLDGKIESSRIPHSASVELAKIMSKVRTDVGYGMKPN